MQFHTFPSLPSKRPFCVVLALSLAACSAASSADGTTNADVNGDGKLSPAEARTVIDELAKMEFSQGLWDVQVESSVPGPSDQEWCLKPAKMQEFANEVLLFNPTRMLDRALDEEATVVELHSSDGEYVVSMSWIEYEEENAIKIQGRYSDVAVRSNMSFDIGGETGSIIFSAERVGSC